MIKIAPSILTCDFMKLRKLIQSVEKAGADMLHLDIMDGHFVSNISFGPMIVSSISKVTKLPLDVHLMIEDPIKFTPVFAKAGARIITIHLEGQFDIKQGIEEIKKHGVGTGIALNPGTPLERLFPYVREIDMALLMTVEPGYGGQKFMTSVIPKIAKLREFILQNRLSLDIQVDGGINPETALLATKNGANILVAGEYIFGSENPAKAIRLLRKACEQ